MFLGSVGLLCVIPWWVSRWLVCPVFPCTLEKPPGMSLYSVWTLLGTCHNLGLSGISGRYIQETTLKFSMSRGQFLLHGIRLWSDSILVNLCSLPQSKTTSNWLTTDTWEPNPFWEFSGGYFTSSAIHSWVTLLSYWGGLPCAPSLNSKAQPAFTDTFQ